jgi:hypothetical protein
MRTTTLILIAPLLLGALYGTGAAGATAEAPAAGARETPASPDEALETPAPPDEALDAPGAPDPDEPAPGPRFAAFVSKAGDPDPFAPPPPASLADDPPADEATPRPTAAEWREAQAVAPARSARGCKAQRVREWLRVACPVSGELAAMDLLAGPREGVAFEPRTKRGSAQGVIFPLRRGDRRVFEVVHVEGFSRYTTEYDVAFTVSEDWLADAKGPTVVVD